MGGHLLIAASSIESRDNGSTLAARSIELSSSCKKKVGNYVTPSSRWNLLSVCYYIGFLFIDNLFENKMFPYLSIYWSFRKWIFFMGKAEKKQVSEVIVNATRRPDCNDNKQRWQLPEDSENFYFVCVCKSQSVELSIDGADESSRGSVGRFFLAAL